MTGTPKGKLKQTRGGKRQKSPDTSLFYYKNE